MSDRCVSLMVALQEGVEGLEGNRALEVADEVEVFVLCQILYNYIID